MTDETAVTFSRDRALAARPFDLCDRRILARFGLPTFLQLWLNLGIPVTEIPGSYWVQDVDDKGCSVAVVSCPCGNSPSVPAGGMEMCREEAEWDQCSRAFVFTGRSVIAANSPLRS